jgi:hypothetical protein
MRAPLRCPPVTALASSTRALPRRVRVAAASALALTIALAGCGGGGSPKATGKRAPARPKATSPVPAAGESVDAAAKALVRAASASGCDAVKARLQSIYSPVSPGACASVKALLSGIHDVKAKRYGSGAVVDYLDANGAVKSAVLALDRDRRFKVVFIEPSEQRTLDTLPAPDFDSAARTAWRAIAAGDCERFLRVAHRTIGPGSGSDQQVCARLTGLPERAAFAARRARLVRLGGNSLYAFYGLSAGPRSYYTIVMAQQPPSPQLPRGAARYAFVNALRGP